MKNSENFIDARTSSNAYGFFTDSEGQKKAAADMQSPFLIYSKRITL